MKAAKWTLVWFGGDSAEIKAVQALLDWRGIKCGRAIDMKRALTVDGKPTVLLVSDNKCVARGYWEISAYFLREWRGF